MREWGKTSRRTGGKYTAKGCTGGVKVYYIGESLKPFFSRHMFKSWVCMCVHFFFHSEVKRKIVSRNCNSQRNSEVTVSRTQSNKKNRPEDFLRTEILSVFKTWHDSPRHQGCLKEAVWGHFLISFLQPSQKEIYCCH